MAEALTQGRDQERRLFDELEWVSVDHDDVVATAAKSAGAADRH